MAEPFLSSAIARSLVFEVRLDMLCTCNYVHHMRKMIQIRNVPEALHRKLKVRAAEAGLSLSDYLLREVRKSAEQPTLPELLERLKRRTPVHVKESPAEILRAAREGRDRR